MNFPAQTNTVTANDDTIDLQNFFQVILRFKWRILSLAFIVTLLATVIVFSLTPKYFAKATLLIEAEQANVVSIEEVYGINSNSQEYFVTQLEILKSKHISARVIKRLDLVNHPEFDPDQQAEKFNLVSFIKEKLPFLPQSVEDISEKQQAYIREQKVLTEFMSRLSIGLIKKTQLITISFESESPELAAEVVNTVAEVYIDNHLESKLAMTEKASSWLNERLNALKTKLDDSENYLQAYQNQEQLVDIDGVKGIEAKELQELNSLLSTASQLRKKNENIYKLVQDKKSDPRTLISLPEVLNHKLIQSVNEAAQKSKTKVYELQGTYGPKHPVMIAAQSELRSVNDNLVQQVELLVSGITNEYLSAKANEEALQAAIKAKGQRFRELSTLDSKQKELKREVETNEQLYNAFFTRLKETKEVGEFQSANARLTDPAQPPLLPAKPNKKLIIIMTFVLSLIFGLVLAFLFEFLNDGIRSVDDIENKLKQRLLGLLPLQKTPRKQGLALRHFFSSEEHSFSEAVRTIRTSLLLLNIEHDAKVISVTSSVPGEGKTTVSLNLSFALGQLERVLLIDADMRRPSVAKNFELPSYQTGLSNIIAGTHSVEECLIKDTQSGVDIITAGTLPPNPQELLASSDFANLISSLKGKYDRIVIDTPPTQAVSDAILVAQHSQSLVYVVKADHTREKMIQSGLGRLLSAGVRIDGIVLNQVDLKQAAKYGEYTGYYDQYGYNAQVASDNTITTNKSETSHS
ncbi:polysaccharide biosynthesis tyrosine autokinase [Colwellia sp. D2M02]|uniref:GumC family protein n=1 Tax=Colwellia sp. D2M02 TaxID=2841562 RepID=UPI001C0A14E8|nr:polysaccharide biosynthesis tyrosine autokinase [Colwellia sp. D2M02]MBU2892253.1 polysaccharide biosynthesis tyrosine autokinase [Colwellia sp. D2M02]